MEEKVVDTKVIDTKVNATKTADSKATDSKTTGSEAIDAKVIEAVIKAVMQLPGLAGIATHDFENKSETLTFLNYHKGVHLIEKPQSKLDVNLAVILLDGARAKGVVNDAAHAIKNVLKQHQKSVGNINVYIRGIK